MAVVIAGVEPRSIGEKAGIRPGQTLLTLQGQAIRDVLDYRFYMTDTHLTLTLLDQAGKPQQLTVDKEEYDDLGLTFDTYLMDRQHHCKNKCIFCFVDQLPRGLRQSLYFKDDDSRMSFFFGSYVTLTNMEEEDIRRIIRMKLSPINISVHATDPEVRQFMLKNPRAGETLGYIGMLTQAGIKVNTQLVLCPGVNDGEVLRRSLYDLARYAPNLQSIALVPVGLTKHREGLHPLKPMTRQEARGVLEIASAFGDEMKAKHGTRLAFAADELFIIAEEPIPQPDYYEDFDQLEDGVGIHALLRQQFLEALEDTPGDTNLVRQLSLACGTAAAPLLDELLGSLKEKFPGVTVWVHGVENRLFGDTVNVSGLLCGADLVAGLADRPLGEELLLPRVMLRHETDLFLDDKTVPWLEEALHTPVRVLEVDGYDLLDAITTPNPLKEVD